MNVLNEVLQAGQFTPQRSSDQLLGPRQLGYQQPTAVTSPSITPRYTSEGTASGPISPDGSRSGRLTEPRNYAPRTCGLPAAQEPPPKFNLGLASPQHQVSSQDPFNGPSNGLHYNQEMTALAPYEPHAVPFDADKIRSQRSERLNMLTNTPSGLPPLAVAMDPTNFPFVEGARQSQAVSHGVVKLRNVSLANPCWFS